MKTTNKGNKMKTLTASERTFQKLCSEVTKRDVKKKELTNAKTRKCLALASDVLWEEAALCQDKFYAALLQNGKRRAKKVKP